MKKIIATVFITFFSLCNSIIAQNITQSGDKVGINQPYPSSTLDVNGDIQLSNASIPLGLTTEVGGTTPLLNFDVNFRASNKNNAYPGATFRIDSRVDIYPVFQWVFREAGSTSETFNMVLTKDGKLGVGTFTPSNKLDVKSSSNNVDPIIESENDLNTSSYFYTACSTSEIANMTIIENTLRNPILFNPYGGNVGIGKVNPNYKFSVYGKINSDDVHVKVSSTSNRVFDAEYNLLSLQETQEYITENKHLPEMPSAEEMKEDGIELGEMNLKLLKKIEELTLHQIELMQEMRALKNELQQLKENK
ncbi:vacuolar protein sorting family 37 protein [Flammeovirga aprica]|uniref:Uncharacterized protein n=1 Tax=Flammeovirga aprica JL-4 TaxID=694437 RepID=A0A7X9XC41_9BACT|nr:hypothetical protein [Flammeovirga aprica]NME71412.1 hypothetical protein [Flammeovirga aprica JL-4]